MFEISTPTVRPNISKVLANIAVGDSPKTSRIIFESLELVVKFGRAETTGVRMAKGIATRLFWMLPEAPVLETYWWSPRDGDELVKPVIDEKCWSSMTEAEKNRH